MVTMGMCDNHIIDLFSGYPSLSQKPQEALWAIDKVLPMSLNQEARLVVARGKRISDAEYFEFHLAIVHQPP
jgi:hypothetical protein